MITEAGLGVVEELRPAVEEGSCDPKHARQPNQAQPQEARAEADIIAFDEITIMDQWQVYFSLAKTRSHSLLKAMRTHITSAYAVI